jgi:signal transduction histidine kinase
MPNSPHQAPLRADPFVGGGRTAELARTVDWASTSIGSVEEWPQSLRTAVSICLASSFPQLVWWGPDLIQIYNDAYCPVLGEKHPHAMGQQGDECWAEIWDVVGPMYRRVKETGRSTWSEDLLLVMERHGFTEETYFTFSYSAIRDESETIAGVLVTCVETTERVVGERRLDTLRALAAEAAEARVAEHACEAAVRTLGRNSRDLPFVLLYLLDETGTGARLMGVHGLTSGAELSPERLEIGGPGSSAGDADPWMLGRVAATGFPEVVTGIADRVGNVGSAPWAARVDRAVVVPVARPGQERPAALLVAGVSPALRFDDGYRTFLELAAGSVATAIANAEAYEAERKRAEALAELDRAKTTFFSNISHEFRTPLTLLLGPLDELLRSGQGDAAQREQFQVMRRNALRLQKLVNTLLDFARIEAGRVSARYEPTDLAARTRELASMFRAATERAGIELRIDAPPLREPVHVDRDMWEKIVLNLLSNALKFTFEGSITIRLREVDGRAELSVSDTGTGIPETELPHLFERFRRVERARARTQEGSGIGLALVKELAALHGGEVAVESEMGRGSTFRVSIPLGRDHLPRERVHDPTGQASTALGAAPFMEEALRWLDDDRNGASRHGDEALLSEAAGAEMGRASASRGARILVAEDNADMRDYLRRLLEGHWRVTTLANGEQALRSARADPPDLVVADIMMPGMDGLALLAALRAEPATRQIPIVLLSARAGEESRIEGMAAGADDYLVKPFSAREFLARVGAHLEMATLRREAAAEREVLLEREQASRRAAEEANLAKAQFLATMSHELRTPLNAIVGFTDLLQAEVSGPVTAGQVSHLGKIDSAARHLIQIIEEILSFSRIEAGREEVHAAPADLAEVVRETASFVEPLAARRNLAFVVHLPAQPVAAVTDAGKVRQIVLNLLSNAVKFTEQGRVELTLRPSDAAVEIEVLDTGIGIPAAQAERVFEPFRQLDRGKQRTGTGTGLGLAVTRQLARLLGGDVRLEPRPGGGSVFTVTLPREVAETDGEGATAPHLVALDEIDPLPGEV